MPVLPLRDLTQYMRVTLHIGGLFLTQQSCQASLYDRVLMCCTLDTPPTIEVFPSGPGFCEPKEGIRGVL